MNIREFIEILESYERDRGEYQITIEEIPDIGIIIDDEHEMIILEKIE